MGPLLFIDVESLADFTDWLIPRDWWEPASVVAFLALWAAYGVLVGESVRRPKLWFAVLLVLLLHVACIGLAWKR